MARVCDLCGKGSMPGHNVSHAKNRSKRRWYPNLHKVRVEVEGQIKTLKICTRCLKSDRVKKAPRFS